MAENEGGNGQSKMGVRGSHSNPTHYPATGRNGNGAVSGWVAPIPTPPCLAKPIPIPVPFKKLNGTGQGGAGMRIFHMPCLAFFFFKILLNFLITLK